MQHHPEGIRDPLTQQTTHSLKNTQQNEQLTRFHATQDKDPHNSRALTQTQNIGTEILQLTATAVT